MPLNFDAIPYSGRQAGELVLEPMMEMQAISNIFTVVSGLKGKQVSYELGRVGKVTKKDAGCGTGKSAITSSVTPKYWEPNDLKIWIAECWTNFRGKVLEWKLKTLDDKSDLTDTDIQAYLMELLKDAGFRDLWRLAWFGKKTITAAELTNGTPDVENYNGFNGIWQQVFAGVASSDPKQKIKRVTIAKNAETTAAAQDIADADAFPLFQTIFNAAPRELKAVPKDQWQFFVTDQIFTHYLNWRESQNLDSSYTAQGDGITTLKYRNVPIIVVPEWDSTIAADFFKSGKYDMPLRSLLTAKGNLQIGFDEQPFNTGTENPFKVWYNEDTEEWNARLKYAADTKIANPKLVVAAY